MSFAKIMGKSIGKNISKNSSGKYGQKRLDHAKTPATDALKTSSKRVIQKSFKRTINWNKYDTKLTVQEQNRYLDFLINPSFPGGTIFH